MITLRINDLVTKYGSIAALKGISLQVESGQVTTIIGSNGAGKSTLLRTIIGLLKPTSGSIEYLGNHIENKPSDKIVKAGISMCPEGRRILPRQTVSENLRMGAFPRNDKEIDNDIQKYFEMFPVLAQRKDQKSGSLSGGEQQMLAISRAVMARPKLLLLDEPSMGLAPLVVQEVFRIIRQVHDSGVTVLLVEQNAKQALKVADYAYILEVGKIVGEGPASVLLENDEVKRSYLGITQEKI
jgi:branched-chain amino acid transport system ATP-binding protein